MFLKRWCNLFAADFLDCGKSVVKHVFYIKWSDFAVFQGSERTDRRFDPSL